MTRILSASGSGRGEARGKSRRAAHSTVRSTARWAACAALAFSATTAYDAPLLAQDAKTVVANSIDAQQAHDADVARQIWSYAELGFQETRSSNLLQQQLREAGFEVEAGIAGMPTAFVAEWGSGKPVIGILAEFDALPGLSQDTVPFRQPLIDGGSGHGCGHNLFGTASTAAAIGVKQWLEASQTGGTIRLYGTPAEEGGDGKVFMVMDGQFDDVDAVLSWHPGDRNDASPSHNLAVISAFFRFHGVSAHAAAAPDRGRSALDAAEAMDMMVNQMREHVPQTTRIHNVIRNGGLAPNVVPDYAESEYYVRHPSADTTKAILERVIDAARGAALGTGTTMDYEIFNGSYAHLTNQTLARLMDANLRRVGGVTYSPEETAFARQLQTTLGDHPPTLTRATEIQPFDTTHMTYASSDVGDVSWVVPTTGLSTATWVPGTAAHTWQAVAVDGMSIGSKGLMVAAKTLAMTAVDLFTTPAALQQAMAEFEQRRGPDFEYRSLIGDREPPLDYRKAGGQP
jgi:aminobenzoyl-glutamate utilization protein B